MTLQLRPAHDMQAVHAASQESRGLTDPDLPLSGLAPVLDCLAGFYGREADARQALREIEATLRLPGIGLALLRPTDAGRLRFMRLARRWRRRPHADGHAWSDDPLLIGIGVAVACAFAGACWFVADDSIDLGPEVLPLIVGLSALAGSVCAGAVFLLRGRPQHRRFDRAVRRQLGDGLWAVVAHDLPATLQARVVEVLRRSSLNWCAVSSMQPWLA